MQSNRVLAAACLLFLVGCGEDAPSGEPPAAAQVSASDFVADEDGLKELMNEWIGAQNANQRARYLEILRNLVPTKAQLRSLLRDGPARDAFLSAAKGLTVEDGGAPKEPPAGKPLPKTARTDVFVYHATTEELTAYAKGTVAFEEFPGGMRRFAARVAAPRRVWYAVELREPGRDRGTRITAFTRLGGRFLIVPKPWRAIPREEGPSKTK